MKRNFSLALAPLFLLSTFTLTGCSDSNPISNFPNGSQAIVVQTTALASVAGPVGSNGSSSIPVALAGASDSNIQYSVRLVDASGTAIGLAGVTVTVALGANPSGSAALGGTTTATTDANGVASFTNLTVSQPGVGYTLVASLASGKTLTSSAFTILARVPTTLHFANVPNVGPGVSTPVTFTLADQFGDANNSPVAVTASVPASFTITSSPVTPVSGTGTYTFVGNQAGTGFSFTATSGQATATSNTFSVVANIVATTLNFTVQPNATQLENSAIAPPVQLKILDQNGLPIANQNVSIALRNLAAPTVTLTSGSTVTAATNALGVATFSNLVVNGSTLAVNTSNFTLVASGPNSTSATSSPFAVNKASLGTLAFGTQPSNVPTNTAMTPSVTVSVRDSQGNLVPSSTPVTLQLFNSTGTAVASVSGNTATTTGGVATFNNLQIGTAGTGYTLVAGSAGYVNSPASTAFNVTPVASPGLTFSQQPPATVTVNAPISPTLVVQVRDASGNLVTTPVQVVIRITDSNGNLLANIVNNVATSVNGIASFPNLAITVPGTGYHLQAVATGLTTITSTPVQAQ